jgi:TonB family protein
MNWAYIALPLLGISLLQDRDLSLRVERSVPPSHPVNTLATGVTVVEIELDGLTGGLKTRPLYGEQPFATSALKALMGWRFALPPEADLARTSITFLFRSPAIYAARIPALAVRPWAPGLDIPALPQEVVDPMYPAASTAQGVVILAAKVSAEGEVTGVETVSGDALLAEQSRAAVKAWRFSPARKSMRNVPSTAYIVVSFVRPT